VSQKHALMRTGIQSFTCLLLVLFVIPEVAAQQLPSTTGAMPELRRGPDGKIEVVKPNPERPPETSRKTPNRRHETATPSQSALPPAGAAPAVPLNNAPAGTTPATFPDAAPAGLQQPTPPAAAAQPPTEISLPDVLAIEMPPGVAQLDAADTRLHNLLGAAVSGKRQVTNDQKLPVRVGSVRINFTAWQGEPWKSAPFAIRSGVLHVLPAGTTPVGVSNDENATAGGNSAKIARDVNGRVHLVWLDSGRPNTNPRVLYRRATVSADDVVTWETEPIHVNDAGVDVWNAYPALAVAGTTVHIVWQGEQTARYRRLSLDGSAWRWGPVRDTAAASTGHDIGPAIAATTAGLLHVATPSGFDSVSHDNGETWKAELIPLPAGRRALSASVVIDRLGKAHFGLSAPVRDPEAASQDKASRGYWELQYVSRTADGVWSASENALAGAPEWAEPKRDDDVLAAWVRILADDDDNLHFTWHGTGETRIYGNDHAYYMRLRAKGRGILPASAGTPVSLVPHSTAKSRPFSFVPSLAVDGKTAVAVAFYDVFNGSDFVGFDALARVLRGGIADPEPIPITEFARKSIEQRKPEAALSTRFAVAAPQLYRDAQGRIWLDLLETLVPAETNPKLVVYQRVNLTSAIGANK
jgi:hypothetical protein